MGVLSGPYQPVAYNKSPDFFDAYNHFVKVNAKSYLAELGQIFIKHQIQDNYGLILVHRHFEMSENEILVETMGSDKSIAIPWVVDGDEALPSDAEYLNSQGFNCTEPNQHVFPQSWAFDKETGLLQPFEYLAASPCCPPAPAPSEAFIQELFCKLKECKLETVLGLRLLNDRKYAGGLESTPDGVRANVVCFGMIERGNGKYADASWFFKENGDQGVVVGCWYGCLPTKYGHDHRHGESNWDG